MRFDTTTADETSRTTFQKANHSEKIGTGCLHSKAFRKNHRNLCLELLGDSGKSLKTHYLQYSKLAYFANKINKHTEKTTITNNAQVDNENSDFADKFQYQPHALLSSFCPGLILAK